MGAEKSHCWSCKEDLTSQAGDLEIFHDRWRRKAGDLALRVPITFANSNTRCGVQVDHGTKGLLFIDGAFKEALGEGHHDLVGAVNRIKQAFKLSKEGGSQTEAIIVPEGKVSFLVDLDGLALSDSTLVKASTVVTVKLHDFDKFYTELMLDNERFGSQEFANSVYGVYLNAAVRDVISSQNTQTLHSSVAYYPAWQQSITVSMNEHAADYGIEVVSVYLNSFDSPELTKIREGAGIIEGERQKLALQTVLDKLSAEKGFQSLSSELEYRELEAQLMHQFSLKESERQLIRDRFLRDSGHEERMKQLAQTQEYQAAKATGDLTQNQLNHQVTIATIRYTSTEEKEKLVAELERKQMLHDHDVKTTKEWADIAIDNLEKLNEVKARKQAAKTADRLTLAHGLTGTEDTAKLAAMGESVLDGMKVNSQTQVGIAEAQARAAQAQNGNGAIGVGSSFIAGETMPSSNSSASLDSCVGYIRVVKAESVKYLGTAWMISPDHAITCAHVAELVRHHIENGGAAAYLCFTVNGASHEISFGLPNVHAKWRDEPAALNPNTGVTGDIPPFDLAVLPLDEKREHCLTLAEGDSVHTGQAVSYVGFPVDHQANVVGAQSLSSYTSAGVIASLTDWWSNGQSSERADIVRINEAVTGGISGSPLLNKQNQIIGVLTAGSFQNVRGNRVQSGMGGYAVHVRHLRKFYAEWLEAQKDS